MRYYFDLRTARGVTRDPEGAAFDTDGDAMEAAKREALGIAADYLRDGAPLSAEAVIIRDEQGRAVAEIEIASLVKTFLR